MIKVGDKVRFNGLGIWNVAYDQNALGVFSQGIHQVAEVYDNGFYVTMGNPISEVDLKLFYFDEKDVSEIYTKEENPELFL